jgi:hypothetical protein
MAAPFPPAPATPSWRFDALDARAGMAFASLDGPHRGDENVVYFGPPTFHPEPVGRTSLAFGATRRGYQEGLVINDREASFPSLAAMGEFIRRAYVRGSSGDGGPTDEGPIEPIGPGPDDPGLSEDNDGGSTLRAFEADMRRFQASVEKCNFGEASTMTWSVPSDSGTYQGEGMMLFRGAAYVLRDAIELRRTLPDDTSSTSLWHLSAVLWSMGIDPYELIGHIERGFPAYPGNLPPGVLNELGSWPYDVALIARGDDRLDFLSGLPGPDVRASGFRRGDLLAWLSRFLATPGDVVTGMRFRECIERATFAAAVLVNRKETWGYRFSDPRPKASQDRLAHAALIWLQQHLPRMAYCSAYETTLASVA